MEKYYEQEKKGRWETENRYMGQGGTKGLDYKEKKNTTERRGIDGKEQ